MKKRLLVLAIAALALLCALAVAGAETLDYTAPFVGRWSLNVADYPAFAEEGLTEGTITLDFQADGTASTYYNGEETSVYAYIAYNDYYVAVTPDGEVKSSNYAFSEDGQTLTLTDIEGEWKLVYHRETDE